MKLAPSSDLLFVYPPEENDIQVNNESLSSNLTMSDADPEPIPDPIHASTSLDSQKQNVIKESQREHHSHTDVTHNSNKEDLVVA
eukprot:Awhi_evm1s4749